MVFYDSRGIEFDYFVQIFLILEAKFGHDTLKGNYGSIKTTSIPDYCYLPVGSFVRKLACAKFSLYCLEQCFYAKHL